MLPEIEKLKTFEAEIVKQVREYQHCLKKYETALSNSKDEDLKTLSEYEVLEDMMAKGLNISRIVFNNLEYILKPGNS